MDDEMPGGESTKRHRDLTDGGIVGTIIYLAWPMVVGFSLQTSFNIIDTFFVGRLGPDALAAVSMVFPVIFFMLALGNGIGVGVTSLVARSIGAGRLDVASMAAEQAFLLAGGVSVFFCLGGLAFQDPLFNMIGAGPTLLPLVTSYSSIIFIWSGAMFFAFTANSILRGEGDTRTPMRVMAIAAGVNVVLDPLLIFGLGPVPRLGVAGAALATVTARTFGLIYVLRHILGRKALIRIGRGITTIRFEIVKEILRVGIPSSLRMMAMSLGMMVMVKITSLFGPLALAAFGIGFRMDSVAFMPALGVGTAIITLVGQNVGARKIGRAEKTVRVGMFLMIGIMSTVAAVFLAAPTIIIKAFTDDPAVTAMGVNYLRIIAMSYPMMAVVSVIGAAFQGAGRAMPALAIDVVRTLLVAIPLAWVFSRFFGVGGIWFGLALANGIAAAVAFGWYRTVGLRGIGVPSEISRRTIPETE